MYTRIVKTTLLCMSFIGFLSCEKKQELQNLYAIDSLVSRQVKFLSENQATLKKVTQLGEKHDEATIIPKDSIAWKKELEIFMALDMINKPVNGSLYRIDTKPDERSNLSVKSFTTEEDLPVKYLRVYFQQVPEKVRKIEAQINDSNILYSSARILTMEFQQLEDKTVLTSYSIVGGQNMLMGDSVHYNVIGTVSNSK